jgi:hypothetical protein
MATYPIRLVAEGELAGRPARRPMTDLIEALGARRAAP